MIFSFVLFLCNTQRTQAPGCFLLECCSALKHPKPITSLAVQNYRKQFQMKNKLITDFSEITLKDLFTTNNEQC